MIMAKRKLRKGIALKLALLAALFVVATLGTAFGLNYLFNRPQEEKKREEAERPERFFIFKNVENHSPSCRTDIQNPRGNFRLSAEKG